MAFKGQEGEINTYPTKRAGNSYTGAIVMAVTVSVIAACLHTRVYAEMEAPDADASVSMPARVAATDESDFAVPIDTNVPVVEIDSFTHVAEIDASDPMVPINADVPVVQTEGPVSTASVEVVTPIKVAVVDLSSAKGESFVSCNVTMSPLTDAGREMSDELAERLKNWRGYELLTRETVRRVVAKHKLEQQGLCKLKTLEKLAVLTGADAVVVGQTEGSKWVGKGHAGASLYASVQMISTRTADVVWNIEGCMTDTQSSETIVSALAGDMTNRLYVKLHELEATRPLLAYKESN